MTRSPDNPSIHFILVAGEGAFVEQGAPILHLMGKHLKERGIGYTAVDGLAEDEQGLKTVVPPSVQQERIDEAVNALPEDTKVVVVSHCIGAIAAVGAVEKQAGGRSMHLMATAPPLPTPEATIAQPPCQGRRTGDGRLKVSYFEEPVDMRNRESITRGHASIPKEYVSDVVAAHDLEERLRALVESGDARVFAAGMDWNDGSPKTVERWHAEWGEWLSPDEAEGLRTRASIVQHAGHGFYPDGLDWDGVIDAQSAAGAAMLSAILEALA